ncbi:MAG: bifunctional diguanylate cyclase/phosphodiesterase, partial [Gemmatimonadaceae bacterium]|nr:bifunctional diguanylate cyclase/phosphodiesterase [Gemmatimonadaceae bacterium]
GEPIELELRLGEPAAERIVRVVGEIGTEGRDRAIVAGALQDLTELRKSEQLAAHLALHDDLTGLGNRRWFLGGLRDVLAEATAADETVLVAWLDITRFQRINDALGTPVADTLLRRFARRLQSHLPAPTLVARTGGDEFAVAYRAADAERARTQLDTLLDALAEPIALASGETVLQVAAGVAWAPHHADAADALMALAEEAQKAARSQGAPALVTSRGDGAMRGLSEYSLERALRMAVHERRLTLAVQPQMELHTGRIVGVECLLRWTGEDGVAVPPTVFVPILEETGLIVDVGAWVLEEACALQRAWVGLGHDLRVGLNVSPRQFVDPQLLARFAGILAGSGVAAGRIELELTETLAMQQPEHTERVLATLREMGALVAVDDFGVGHSSLAYLLRFPIDTLKLDRSFVSGITTNRANQAIVRAATAMAQSVGLTTIAEGVETLREADFLDALGVHEIQGWLVGRPMPAADFPAFLTRFTRPGLGTT